MARNWDEIEFIARIGAELQGQIPYRATAYSIGRILDAARVHEQICTDHANGSCTECYGELCARLERTEEFIQTEAEHLGLRAAFGCEPGTETVILGNSNGFEIDVPIE